jgi:hypothetical protein
MSSHDPDLSPLLPDDATLKLRRSALIEAIGPPGPRPTPPRRRRGPRLALGGVAALVVLATILIISAGGDQGSTAFAVEPQDGGGVTIKLYSAEDASGLEAALGDVGIRSHITWLPAGMACREPRFTPSTAPTAMGGEIGGFTVSGPGPAMTIGIMTPGQYRRLWRDHQSGKISAEEFHHSTGNVNLDPAGLRPDQSVVISGAPSPSPDREVIINGPTGPYKVDPEGGYEASFAIAEGPVEACSPVEVPDGGMLEATNRVIAEEAAQQGLKVTQSGATFKRPRTLNGR